MRTFADIVKNVIGEEKVIYVCYEKEESKVVTNWENFLEIASKIDYLDTNQQVKGGIRFVMEDNSYWEFVQDDGWYFSHVVPVDYATLPISKITKVEELFY